MGLCKIKNKIKQKSVSFLLSVFPNNCDNILQISIKISYLLSIILLIFLTFYFTHHFFEIKKEEDYINSYRNIYESFSSVKNDKNFEKKALKKLNSLNNECVGWITISGTKINNPIFQTNNNSYFLNHNQNKEESIYGALHFDCKNKISKNKTDKNLVIYGNKLSNGAMFGELDKLRNTIFLKSHSIIELSTLYNTSKYKVFSVFLLNGNKKDDGNYIYNIYRKRFINDEDFDDWINEAYDRSVINTGVKVDIDDNIITLVTSANDFENARLVVMAKEITKDDSTIKQGLPKANYNPRYPKIWYSKKQ